MWLSRAPTGPWIFAREKMTDMEGPRHEPTPSFPRKRESIFLIENPGKTTDGIELPYHEKTRPVLTGRAKVLP